jgi:putative transposase
LPAERRRTTSHVQGLFDTALDPDFLDALRTATNGGWAMGNDAFKTQIAEALTRRVAPLPKGRPPKEECDDGQINLL